MGKVRSSTVQPSGCGSLSLDSYSLGLQVCYRQKFPFAFRSSSFFRALVPLFAKRRDYSSQCHTWDFAAHLGKTAKKPVNIAFVTLGSIFHLLGRGTLRRLPFNLLGRESPPFQTLYPPLCRIVEPNCSLFHSLSPEPTNVTPKRDVTASVTPGKCMEPDFIGLLRRYAWEPNFGTRSGGEIRSSTFKLWQ